MKVKELIDVLAKFSPDDEVRLAITWGDRVTELYEQLWVGDHGEGPQINAGVEFKGVGIYVGCVLQQAVGNRPRRTLDLGQYENAEVAAKVRDFYLVHKRIDEPLNFPDFDYEKWIPPRTRSGEYNQHIAEILKEKLLDD